MRFAWILLPLCLLLATGSRCRSQGLKQRVVLPAHEEGVRCLAISPDGKTVATGSRHYDHHTRRASGQLKLWDVETGKPRVELRGHTDGIEVLAFSPNGKILATGAARDAIKLWDVRTGKESLSFRGSDISINCLAFSPDGKTLGYVSYQNVRLLNAATGKVLSSFRRPGRGDAAVFSNDQKMFATPNHQDANLYDTATGMERLVLEDHRGGVYRLAFSADGKSLAVASIRWEDPKHFSEIKLWDPTTGRERAVFKDRINFVRSVALSRDGKLLAVAGAKDLDGPNVVKLIDVATSRELAVMAATKTDWVWCLAFSPDSRLLAGGTGKTLTLWDVLPAAGGTK
jgi:COMPASS component SWD3